MRETLTPAVICIVAVLLRTIHANAGLWFDEIITIEYFVRRPLVSIATDYAFANNHVLNSVLAHLAVAALGEQPWVVRLPAIAFGIAGVWAFWFVASRLWMRSTAAAGTALFAVSYHHVYYSQNARGYSALMFFALAAAGLQLRLADEGRDTPRHAAALGAGYAAAIGVGLYAMLLMAFVAVGHGIVLLATRRFRALMWLTAGAALALLLYAPMAGSLLRYYRAHPEETGFALLSVTFLRAVGVLAVAGLVAAPVALFLLARLARRHAFATALLVTPLVLNVAIPLVRGQGVYPRSFVYGLPVAYLIATEGIDWLRTRRPVLMAPALVAAGLVSVGMLWPVLPSAQAGIS